MGMSFDHQSSQWPRHFLFDPGGSQLFSIGRKVWTGCKRNSQQDESRLSAFGVFVFLMRKSLCAITAWKVVDSPFPQRPLVIHPSLTTEFSRVMKSIIKTLNPFFYVTSPLSPACPQMLYFNPANPIQMSKEANKGTDDSNILPMFHTENICLKWLHFHLLNKKFSVYSFPACPFFHLYLFLDWATTFRAWGSEQFLSLTVLAAGHMQDAQQQRLHPVPSSVLGIPTNSHHPTWDSFLLQRTPSTKRCLGFMS